MLKLSKLTWQPPEGGQIIKGMDLAIPDGKLVVLTGPNGGGKTTLAKLIAGLETPTSGQIFLDGKDITPLDVTQRARCGVSYAFQTPVRFKGLTVRDLVELAAGGALSEATLCELLGKVGLCAREYMDREINASLSGGEIKRIEIATVRASCCSTSRKQVLTCGASPGLSTFFATYAAIWTVRLSLFHIRNAFSPSRMKS